MTGAQSLLLEAIKESDRSALKSYTDEYFSISEALLSVIDADKIRKKLEEIKDSFPVEAEKLILFLRHYDQVYR
jgi:hypothetical protein